MDVISDRDRLLGMTTYPGMVPAESRILRQYIRRHGDRYTEWRFNVRLGEGVELGEDASPELRKIWARITMERPDTVAWTEPDRATLIEVKELWTNEAVWQLHAYTDLYRDVNPDHRVSMVGVAIEATPNGRTLAARQGITLYLYALPTGITDLGETAPEEASGAA